MLNPVARFDPARQNGGEFAVQYGLPLTQYTLELRLNQVGPISQHLADAFPQVRFGRYAIHLR